MAAEDKWKANSAKVAFTKEFPGLTLEWGRCQGKTVQAVVPLTGKQGGAVLVFTDGSYTIASPVNPEAWELGQALIDARPFLEPLHQDAYREFDRLTRQDREALKSARLEKILGAIENNVEHIPELKDRLKQLVKEWT